MEFCQSEKVGTLSFYTCVSFCSQGWRGWLPSMHHRSHDQGVCIQVGGSTSKRCVHPGGGLHSWGFASREGVGRSPSPRALQDMVNKRAERILLECILVVYNFAFKFRIKINGIVNLIFNFKSI